MRARDTKFPNAKTVLSAVQWNGGFHQAYRDGKIRPKDMPDKASEVLAELVEYYMMLAEDRWEKLKTYLESVPDDQP